MEAHIARGTCRARRHGSSLPPRELDRPYLPTTTRVVAATLASNATQVHQDPSSVPVNSTAIIFCGGNPDFTAPHMRTSGMQSAVALPAQGLSMLLPVITDLLTRSHSTRGVSLRDAPEEAHLLYTKLVLGPQRLGAISSIVKT